MNKIFFSIVLLSFFQIAFSQDIFTDIKDKSVDFFIEKEKKLKSELYKTNQVYYSSDDVAQPIIFRRKEKNIPDLLVYYTFNKKDSTVISILYEWDVSNFEDTENNIKSDQFNNTLIEKYESLLKLITKNFGESKTEGSLKELSKINTKTGLRRKDIWKPTNSLELEMYITVSNFYEQKGLVTFNPTHKIRLYVRKIKE